MAALPTLSLETYSNISNTSITGTEPVLQLIASAVDSSYVADSTNSTHTGQAAFTIGNLPLDFASMTTLSVRLRYAAASSLTNNWNSLSAQVFQSDQSSALTDNVTVASSITTTTPTNSSVISFTGIDTASNYSIWSNAVLVISWSISRVMGGDSVEKYVSAGELTGTYEVSAARYYFIT